MLHQFLLEKYSKHQKQEEMMRRRNNFAKRCAIIQMVLFVTIIISFARVINAPKKLLANPTENVARYIPNIQILTSRDDTNNSTEALSNNQNDTVVSNNITTAVNGTVAINNTAVNVTDVLLGNGNSTEV